MASERAGGSFRCVSRPPVCFPTVAPRYESIVPALVVELPVLVVERIDRFELETVEAFDPLLSFRGGRPGCRVGCDAFLPGNAGGAFLAGMVFAIISRSTGGGGR